MSSRTCPACGHRMSTGHVFRSYLRRLGWRVACPACGRVSTIPTREQLLGGVLMGSLPMLVGMIVLHFSPWPAAHTARFVVGLGGLVVTSTAGAWLSARRARLVAPAAHGATKDSAMGES